MIYIVEFRYLSKSITIGTVLSPMRDEYLYMPT